jgi:DNA-binding CsgD family transcriptional regulator/tetratricopeptide (TPR) repeat protein
MTEKGPFQTTAGIKRVSSSLYGILQACILLFLWGCSHPATEKNQAAYDSLSGVVNRLLKTNADSAILVSGELLGLAAAAKDAERIFEAARLRGQAFQNAMMNDSALTYFRIMRRAAFESGDTLQMMKICNILGTTFLDTGPVDSAAWWYRKGMLLAVAEKDTSFQAAFSANMGIFFNQNGQSDSAMKCYTSAAGYYEKISDAVNLAQINRNIGSVLIGQGMSRKAVHYFRLAETIHRETGDILAAGIDITNLAVAYMELNSDSAAWYYEEAMRIMTEHGSPANLLPVKFNFANYLLKKDRYGEAEKIYLEVLKLSRENRILQGEMYSLNQLGNVATRKRELTRANEFYREAISLARQHKQSSDLMEFLREAYEGNMELKNTDLALSYFKSWNQLKDSLQTSSQRETIMKYQALYETEALKRKISDLNLNASQQRSRNLIIFLASLTGLILLISLMVYLWMQRRYFKGQLMITNQKSLQSEQESRLNKLEIEKLHLDRKISEEALEKLNLEIRLKEQDLVYQTMLRTDLAQVNRSVKEKMSAFQHKFSRKKDREEFLQSIQNLTRDADADPLADFELMFNQLHGSFFPSLLNRCPSLTRSELQVCALIRMNLPSKEIAKMLNLSIATIEITRHHIRKKLNLDSGENLTTFMIRI